MTSTDQPGESTFRAIWPENIDWQPFPAFPAAVRLALLVGDPTRPGSYLARVSVPAGERMMPHTFSDERTYTVISGVFYIGLGDHFDESQLTAHPPGSVLVVPSGQAHFHRARSGDYVIQITGIGPVDLRYLNPGDDPRNF